MRKLFSSSFWLGLKQCFFGRLSAKLDAKNVSRMRFLRFGVQVVDTVKVLVTDQAYRRRVYTVDFELQAQFDSILQSRDR